MSNEYEERNKVLEGMGYPTYSHYLSSTLWGSIRDRVYCVRGRVCTLCLKPARCIHHLSYTVAVLEGEDILPLVPLCDTCHRDVEFNEVGNKRSFRSALRRYHTLAGTKVPSFPQKKGRKRKKGGKRKKRKVPLWTIRNYVLPLCWGCGKHALKCVNYCRRCQPKPDPSEPPSKCRTCNATVSRGYQFCKKHWPAESYCGKKRMPIETWR